jgi:hypothetical protein
MIEGDHIGRHGALLGSDETQLLAHRPEDNELVALAERWKAAFRALVDFQQGVGHSSRPCQNWDAATLEALDKLVEGEREAREMLDGFLVGTFREQPSACGRDQSVAADR